MIKQSVFQAGLAMAAILLVGVKAQAVDLLGYYDFELGFLNASGPLGPGTPTHNPAQVGISLTGFRGSALDINDPGASGGGGDGGALSIPHNANPNESPQVSFGGWFNLQTNNGFPGAVAIDNGGWDRGIHLNNRQWGIASGGNTDNIAPAPTGQWTYVMGTFDKPGNVATLYIGNDVAATQTTISGSRPDAGVNPGEIQIEIGRYNNQDLDALVDDFVIWNEALTADEANALRNLRLNSNLDYSPVDAELLFDLFDAGSGMVTIGDTEWVPGPVAGPNPGGLTDDGNGNFTLRLDGIGNGLIGAAADSGGGGGGGAAVPEPTTLAIWTLLGIVGLAFAGRKLRLANFLSCGR